MTEADNCHYTDDQLLKGRILDEALKIHTALINLQTTPFTGIKNPEDGRISVSQKLPSTLEERIAEIIDTVHKHLIFDITFDPSQDFQSATVNNNGRRLAEDVFRQHPILI